jgi:1-aminocyclopropane-1-carboxylate deaminase
MQPKDDMYRLPSPLERLKSVAFSYHDLDIFIKRDDLIHPFVSGNKLRKLKGWMAQSEPHQAWVSFGGAYSNHLLALAYAGARSQHETFGLVRGEEITTNPVLQHCRLFGMTIIPLSRADYAHRNIEKVAHLLPPHPLIIPEGGKGVPAYDGFVDMLKEPEMKADYYVCAAGTGTTAIGIGRGLDSLGLHSRVVAVACVKDPHIQKDAPKHVIFDFNYTGKGFGKYGDNERQTAQNVVREHGFLLDPVYTCKAWNGMMSLIAQGFFEKNSRIIFIHSGGLSGWWGDKG